MESLRFHLGYGNLDGARLYHRNGFKGFFDQVIAPHLTTGPETSATTAITAGATVAVTPASMDGIAPYTRLVVDVADAAEVVTVRSTTPTTFTATFAKAHPASGYPIAVESGVTRLRMLLQAADAAWQKMQSASITSAAGLKQLGRGEIEWFGTGAVLKDTRSHYDAIVNEIASLVGVSPVRSGGCAIRLEAY